VSRFPKNIDFEVIDLLDNLSESEGIAIPQGGGEDEFKDIATYMLVEDIAELAVWVSISTGPIPISQPLMGFSVDQNQNDSNHYKNVLSTYPEWRRRKWVPIAGDGCGNYYLYPLMNDFNNRRPIFLVDVSKSTITPYCAVASHLFHFLVRLLESELNREDYAFTRDKVLRQDVKIQQISSLAMPWD
jgi:hypothetical protein